MIAAALQNQASHQRHLQSTGLEESLGSHRRFESLLADLSSQFIDASDDQIQKTVRQALRSLAGFVGVDRVVLWTVDEQDHTVRMLGSWLAPGIARLPDPIVAEHIPWSAAKMLAGQSWSFARLDALPSAASKDRRFFRQYHTRSQICIPLASRKPAGALWLASVRRDRTWPVALVHRLRLVGEMLNNLLVHHEAQQILRQQRAELTHAGRVVALGEMATMIAHELNQPLTAILANAQAARRLILGAHADLAEIDEVLKDVADDAARAGNVIQQLRKLLRKEEPQGRPLNINDLVREIEPLIRAETRGHGVELLFDLAEHAPQVIGDRVQIQQVLLNLITNACQAMAGCPRAGRSLLVRTSQPSENQVRVAVQDSGPPTPEPVFRRMFEPFFTTKNAGLGMGLPISRSIIESHGGRLEAMRNDNRGITMYFDIPREEMATHEQKRTRTHRG